MRFEASVTSISWIPSEAVRGIGRQIFDVGVLHYDDPPPETIGDLEALRTADGFRFANELRAWVEVDDGRIVDCGQTGKGHIGATKVRVGTREAVFPAIALPDIRRGPESHGDSVRFVQTAGGRTGVPAPRTVRRKPFVQIAAPIAWTTLALTLRADGTSSHELEGASPFPRHWIYDRDGRLVQKSGVMDFGTWYRNAFGERTPWGDHDSPALVTEVESAVERDLSKWIMRGNIKPKIRAVRQGETLVRQGEEGDTIFLLLDGVLTVEVDGEEVAEIGPGAVLGERAILEGGRRTATLRASTPARVAVAPGDQVDKSALHELVETHRREEDSASHQP